MDYRKIVFIAAAFTIAAWAVVRATGDELPSKDHPAPEPFGDIQPFELSKRTGRVEPQAKDSADANKKTRATTKQPTDLNQKLADEIFKVNNLGDPDRIVFKGVSLFPTEQLRLALARDSKYQAAARPSNNTIDFLPTLENRLREGYLHSGCPDATVHARRDGKRSAIVVQVDEGVRFHKGEIRISGSKAINEKALRELLTKPRRARPWVYLVGDKPLEAIAKDTRDEQKSSADRKSEQSDDSDTDVLWKAGEAVDFRNSIDSRLERGIHAALADLGFANSEYHVELERDAKNGVVNPHVSFPEELSRTVIGEIQVTGLKRDGRKELLDYLKIGQDDPVNADTLRRLDQQLSDSCRYWTHKIEVVLPATDSDSSHPSTTKATLRLALEEYAAAPRLGEPLTRIDEAARKCAWLNSLADHTSEQDLVLTTAAADLGVMAQHVQFAMAGDGTIVIDAQVSSTDGWRANHSILLGPNLTEIYDWKYGDKFCVSPQLFPNWKLSIRTTHNEKGEQNATMMFGFAMGNIEDSSASGKMPGAISVEPVALLYTIHKPPTKAVLRDGVLELSDGEMEMQIDASTGAIRSLKGASYLSGGISAIDIKSQKGFVSKITKKIRNRGADFRNQCNEEDSLRSAITYSLQQIERQPMIKQTAELHGLCRLATLVAESEEVKGMASAWTIEWKKGSVANQGRFTIPGYLTLSPDKWAEDLVFYTPFLADKAFPRGSWPWTLCREYAFWLPKWETGEDFEEYGKLALPELHRMRTANDCGPLGKLLLAKFCSEFYDDDGKRASETANEGLSNMSDEAFLNDVRYIADGDGVVAVVCRAVNTNYGKLSDEDQDGILDLIPTEVRGPFKSLLMRKNSKSDESPSDAIRESMLEMWHDGLREAVEADLRSISTNSTNADKATAAAK